MLCLFFNHHNVMLQHAIFTLTFISNMNVQLHMANSENHGTSKVYCTPCDRVFDSRMQYEQHLVHAHSYSANTDSGGMSCDSCPLDTAISKLLGFFSKRK